MKLHIEAPDDWGIQALKTGKIMLKWKGKEIELPITKND